MTSVSHWSIPSGLCEARVCVPPTLNFLVSFQQNPAFPPMAYPNPVYVIVFPGGGGGFVCIGQGGRRGAVTTGKQSSSELRFLKTPK